MTAPKPAAIIDRRPPNKPIEYGGVTEIPRMQLTGEQSAALLNLARRSIRAALAVPGAPPEFDDEDDELRGDEADDACRGAPPIAPPADPALHQPAGCFVSLHHLITHRLRGCVGRLEPQGPLYHVVARTARAVLSDPRFRASRVTLDELPMLSIEVSVLTPLRDAAHALDFDLHDDGIVLTCGRHSGCFLPQVARETGWTKEQLLGRLCTEKLGLRDTAWRDATARLQTFSTLILGPEAFGDDASGA
jgi:AmmeMemoRadiSam system protein A